MQRVFFIILIAAVVGVALFFLAPFATVRKEPTQTPKPKQYTKQKDAGLGFSVTLPAGWKMRESEAPQSKESLAITLDEITAPTSLPPGRLFLSTANAQGKTLSALIPNFKKSNLASLRTPARTVRLVEDRALTVAGITAHVLGYTVESRKESGRSAAFYAVSNNRLYTVMLMGDMRVWKQRYALIFDGLVSSFQLSTN